MKNQMMNRIKEKKPRGFSVVVTSAMVMSLLLVNLGLNADALSSGFGATTASNPNVITVVDMNNDGVLSRQEVKASFKSDTKSCDIIIPAGIKSIGQSAFFPQGTFFPNIKTITIPETVTSISDYAFIQCPGLESITIPASVKTIGSQVFNDCKTLKTLSVAEGNTVYSSKDNIIYSKDFKTLLYGAPGAAFPELVIPEQVTALADFSLNYCDLGNVTLPAGLKTIGDDAFAFSTLKNIQLPEGLTKIGSGAFGNCALLKINMVLPKSVTSYGTTIFYASGIQSVTINSNIDITASMFNSCQSLKTVVFKGQMKKIGLSAFQGCTALSKIDLPKSLRVISANGFAHSGLTEISLPEGLTHLGIDGEEDAEGAPLVYDGVFSYCNNLKSVTIPSSVTFIRDYCFYICPRLTTVKFANNSKCKTIGMGAFRECLALKSITTNASEIRTDAFRGCKSLTYAIFLEGVKTVGETAFFGASKMKALVLPKSLTDIHVDSIDGDSKDFTIYCKKGSYGDTFAKIFDHGVKINYGTYKPK